MTGVGTGQRLAGAPRTDSGLTVRGGAGGTAARLEDLDQAAATLGAAAHIMTTVALEAAKQLADPLLVISEVPHPLSWLATERTLTAAVAGPHGALAVAARLRLLSTGTQAAVALYRGADAASGAAFEGAELAASRAVGSLLAFPVVEALLVAPVAVKVAQATGLAGQVSRVSLPAPGPHGEPASGRLSLPQVALALLASSPGLVEHAVHDTPAFLGGVVDRTALVRWLAAGVTGEPEVPLDVPSGAGWIGRLGEVGSWLQEDPKVRLTAGPVTPSRAPTGLRDLVAGIGDLDPERGAPPGTVRVTAVTAANGSRAWVVQIPGTQTWTPKAGPDPLDLTGNVRGIAGERTAGEQLVVGALRAAGVPPSEPVLLVGHSQGGIIATQLAADPGFRSNYRVTHVVTVGSPVATARVPDSVSVLAIEHDEDVIPRLDGAQNPDRPGWVTVSRSSCPEGALPSPTVAHDLRSYTATAALVDQAHDPTVERWRAGLTPFVAAPGVSATQLQVTGERLTAATL